MPLRLTESPEAVNAKIARQPHRATGRLEMEMGGLVRLPRLDAGNLLQDGFHVIPHFLLGIVMAFHVAFEVDAPDVVVGHVLPHPVDPLMQLVIACFHGVTHFAHGSI